MARVAHAMRVYMRVLCVVLCLYSTTGAVAAASGERSGVFVYWRPNGIRNGEVWSKARAAFLRFALLPSNDVIADSRRTGDGNSLVKVKVSARHADRIRSSVRVLVEVLRSGAVVDPLVRVDGQPIYDVFVLDRGRARRVTLVAHLEDDTVVAGPRLKEAAEAVRKFANPQEREFMDLVTDLLAFTPTSSSPIIPEGFDLNVHPDPKVFVPEGPRCTWSAADLVAEQVPSVGMPSSYVVDGEFRIEDRQRGWTGKVRTDHEAEVVAALAECRGAWLVDGTKSIAFATPIASAISFNKLSALAADSPTPTPSTEPSPTAPR